MQKTAKSIHYLSSGVIDTTGAGIVDGPSSISFGFVEPDYEPDPEENYEMPEVCVPKT